MALDDVSIIAEVTDTLTNLLDGLDVTLDSPADLKGATGSFEKINLYLYQAVEHAFTKNLPPIAVDGTTLQNPPLTLRLYYLLTPYASDPRSAHKVLGHAMRVFYDNAIVTPEKMVEPLRAATDKLSIVLVSSKLEDLTRIWTAMQTPYRMSVCYEVRVVPIESAVSRDVERVRTRITSYGQV
jgi:Pvc16 N-terminal domain